MFNTVNGHDYDGAVSIANDLVKAENARGGFALGHLYELGFGVAKDEAKAREYYTWATRRGDAEAALSLARFMEQGIGGPVDTANAKTLYTYAARNSVPGADREMQRLQLETGGTILEAYNELTAGENVQRATQFLDAMFANHSGLSYCAVGWLYLRGKTVPVDLAKASGDLRAGAQRGFSWCALGMGKLAASGAPGIPKNLVEAHIWYAFGKAFGILGQQSADVDRQIGEIEAQMSPQDLQTAQYLYASMTTPRSPVN
jgi:TPR repeat protein